MTAHRTNLEKVQPCRVPTGLRRCSTYRINEVIGSERRGVFLSLLRGKAMANRSRETPERELCFQGQHNISLAHPFAHQTRRYVTEKERETEGGGGGGVYAQRKPSCLRVSEVKDQQVCARSPFPNWAPKTCLEIQRLPRNMTRDLKHHIVASGFSEAKEIGFCCGGP